MGRCWRWRTRDRWSRRGLCSWPRRPRMAARILPVDSEHSAIFQALVGEDIAAVERIILPQAAAPCATGRWKRWRGPRSRTRWHIRTGRWGSGSPSIRPACSTRRWRSSRPGILRGRSGADRGDHPSRKPDPFHGGLPRRGDMAHLGAPDMRHSIGYALNWPDRSHLPVARLDLAQVATLTFRAPDGAHAIRRCGWRVR